MPAEFMSAFAFLMGALVAMVATCQSVSKGVLLQQHILKRGIAAQARVLRVWRPPLWGAFTRVYIEFMPEGAADAVRTCHVDRRPLDESRASLPTPGAHVSIKYLPETPTRAVIARLVSRFNR